MSQDDGAVWGDDPRDLVQGGGSQRGSFHNESVHAGIRKRDVIGATGNVPRDRPSPFLTKRFDEAGIEVPSIGMTTLASNVEDEFPVLFRA